MSAQTAQRMRCHDLRYAASRRRRTQGAVRRLRNTHAEDEANEGNEVVRRRGVLARASAEASATGMIAALAAIRLERCGSGTAEHAIVPRAGAINDGEAETRSVERQVSDEGVASATWYCRWNSCRTMATRFR